LLRHIRCNLVPMIEWISVVAILLLGIGLIIVELIFIPGTTVVGVLGLGFCVGGIVMSFSYFGSAVGFIVLILTGVISVTALVISLRSGVWKKFSNESSIQSKFNEGTNELVKIGDEGLTLSTLKPYGKVEFNDKEFEVKTNGNYLERGVKVKIIHKDGNQIIVEPLK